MIFHYKVPPVCHLGVFYLVACGRVLGVDWQEGHGAAFCHQRAVVLGREPHWRHTHEARKKIKIKSLSVCMRHSEHMQPVLPPTHARTQTHSNEQKVDLSVECQLPSSSCFKLPPGSVSVSSSLTCSFSFRKHNLTAERLVKERKRSSREKRRRQSEKRVQEEEEEERS